jgi:hypothetical protein
VSPAPATRAFANGITELGVSLEVVEVLGVCGQSSIFLSRDSYELTMSLHL